MMIGMQKKKRSFYVLKYTTKITFFQDKSQNKLTLLRWKIYLTNKIIIEGIFIFSVWLLLRLNYVI